ncbi:glutathione peroxidase [Methylobacterium sp. 4-46]|uniref:glutathione peroxidase n=1 Tax=unclassified Methylobacterium TaxID=2615210 RepID=UPI000152CC0E|nr:MULTISPECIES: glutathione peroxidase [Methylobacterium]ACA19791.1 glutathione peroxidase [Methylobacterium sp. 4-46]WFT78978.1 glutathione peroxidase [Methylobacterium nodulans]
MSIARREALALLGGLLALPARAAPSPTGLTAASFSFETVDGTVLALAEMEGKPILVVNTATACGFAPQLAGLQQLWTRFGPRGLTVIGVPSGDFGRQEPLDGAAIREAMRRSHGVTFPVVAKTSVTGPGAHPFYRWAAGERPGETPHWNFHKYLVGRDGHVAAAFATAVEPTDPRVITAIARELEPQAG